MNRAAVHAAIDMLLDALFADAEGSGTHDADRLPPGARSRDAFLRRHRDRVRAGVPGWSRVGKARVVTREAWERDVDKETSARRRKAPVAVPAPHNDVVDELDAALGIRTRRAAR